MACLARICLLCPGMHIGDERHYVFDCPSLDIRIRHSRLSDDSHGAMRLFMWHPHQKGVASCLLQVLDSWIDELLTGTNPCVPSAILAARAKFNLLPSLAGRDIISDVPGFAFSLLIFVSMLVISHLKHLTYFHSSNVLDHG